MRILIISDNGKIKTEMDRIFSSKLEGKFDIITSIGLDLKNKEVIDQLIKNYTLIISAHCKKIFPKDLIDKVRCINLHPGYNPYNRGWFPQVFSLINKLPLGATIHEIDEHLDHGPIIIQKQILPESTDTSLSLYNKILDLEIKLFEDNFEDIIYNKYKLKYTHNEGSINYKKDFNQLCELDLNNYATLGEHIDLLRALSHGNFKNAFFIDSEGNKIYIKIELTKW